MRKELKEYKFDWMLWNAFLMTSRLKKGTDKEFSSMLNYIPYFRGVVEAILSAGEPGERFIRISSDYLGNIVNARGQGKKTAITTFCFSPALFYAMDIVPICLEVLSVMMIFTYKRGTAEFLDFCNEAGYTETSCSSQRGSIGAYLAGIGSDIDMIVTDTPGVCDTNANAFAFAASYLNKPFFQLDMPPDLTGARSDEYHLKDYRALIAFLEEQTGTPLDPGRLRGVLLEVQRQDNIVAELEDLSRIVPNPLPALFNLIIYAGRFLFSGREPYTELLESMLRMGKGNANGGIAGNRNGERLRGLFCYIDHYTQNLKFWQMLDDFGIGYQMNILSVSWAGNAPHVMECGIQEAAYSLNTADLDSMIQSLAALNSRMPMIKSIRGPYDAPHMWLQDTLALAKMYKADFIVYNGTPGCRNTWGMVKLFARDTEKAGYPTYIMYADAFDERVESWDATRGRFEEFLHVRGLIS